MAEAKVSGATPKKHQGTTNENVQPQRKHWKGILGCWATNQMAQLDSKEMEMKTTLRELVVHVMFVTVMLLAVLGMTSPTMYYYTKVMSDLFLSTPSENGTAFESATTINDFWSFAEKVMIDNFFWEFWYHQSDPRFQTSDDEKKILYENKLLGLPRLRQLKTESHLGQAKGRRKLICMLSYNNRTSLQMAMKYYRRTHVGDLYLNVHRWTYSSPLDLHGSTHWGHIGTYSGGGYYQDLPVANKTLMVETISKLKQNLWVTRGTRVIFLDFTVYNANINLFCIVKIVLEIPPTGGAFPSWTFKTVKLIRYVTLFDYFIMACEFIVVAFILHYTIEEICEVIFLKWRYLCIMWNWLDITILAVAYTCIFFSVYRSVIVKKTLQNLLENETQYGNFESLGFWEMQYNNAVAVLVFFAWIKIFKYISFNRTMAQLSSTLNRCAKDIAGFAVMFFIVFLAFAQLGYLLFGTQVFGFSTFDTAIFTLLRTILGDFDYASIERANRVLGPIFFLSYIFFVFFVLLNMFLAIINDTYSEVKSELMKGEDFVLSDFLKRGYSKVMHKVGRPQKKKATENLTYKDIKKVLERCNFTDLEIETFFAKYGLEPNDVVGEDEAFKMLEDLEVKQGASSSLPATTPQTVSHAEFIVLKARVENIEKAITTVIDKMESIIVKLDVHGRWR